MGLGFACKGPVIPGIGIGEDPAIADGGIGVGTGSVSVFVFIEESVCATVAWNAIIVSMKPKIFFIVFNFVFSYFNLSNAIFNSKTFTFSGPNKPNNGF